MLQFNLVGKSMRVLGVIAAVCWLNVCSITATNDKSINETAREYFSVYAKRNDFKKFMFFYADHAVLKDIIYGNELKNKSEISTFLDWHRGEFKLLIGDNI